MDSCYETMLVSKRLVKQNSTGKLFEIQTKARGWDVQAYGSDKPNTSKVPFRDDQRTEYVHCSTSKPAVAYKNKNDYTVHLLNPDGKTTFGFNHGSYQMYWVVCHSLLNPVSPATAERAVMLGYSGKLEDKQVTLKSPFDLIASNTSTKRLQPRKSADLGPAFSTTGMDRNFKRVPKYHQAILRSMKGGKNYFGHGIVEMQVLSHGGEGTGEHLFWISVNCYTREWKFLESPARLFGDTVASFGVLQTNRMGSWACKRFGFSY
jgi:hypothetical protein